MPNNLFAEDLRVILLDFWPLEWGLLALTSSASPVPDGIPLKRLVVIFDVSRHRLSVAQLLSFD